MVSEHSYTIVDGHNRARRARDERSEWSTIDVQADDVNDREGNDETPDHAAQYAAL